MDVYEKSLKKHYEWAGKMETKLRAPIDSLDDLALCYTPGVSRACTVIAEDKSKVYELTNRHNTVAVVTDGTAVLGLGDIGPEAAMPVMEGKCALFKKFGDIDATPVCLNTKDTDEIVRTVAAISTSYGGINLEDISAPRCFEIERRLKELCDIPIFHDDQHGTAIVAGAALLNALRVVGKDIKNIRIAINGAGSAGVAIAKFFTELGVGDIVCVCRKGVIVPGEHYDNAGHAELATFTNKSKIRGTLADAIRGADVFLGVSVPNVVTKDMIKSMANKPIVFPLANPVPEITREAALEAGAAVVGTGASNQPNQINNVLIFPGIFRGALDCRATDINGPMKRAAATALASLVSDSELNADYIIPNPLDKRVAKAVSEAVAKAAIESGVARI
ncbi:MAG: NADP-dependent malic enzyme [Clostridiales bacterium]|nr:NADP-dependent malic enzyme [Clostridiales bacterium]